MAEPPAAAGAAVATADLESKEIWGDEADQLDEEIMKVRWQCSDTLHHAATWRCEQFFPLNLFPGLSRNRSQ